MGGATYQGIDFCSIEPTLRLLGIKKSKFSEIFADLQNMQAEALKHLNKEK